VGDERVRLFCALPLPTDAVENVVRWQEEELSGAAGTRLVGSENLHVTLAFLGSTPADRVDEVVRALSEAARGVEEQIVLRVREYRETRSVGMLALADEGGRAAGLAGGLQARLEALDLYRPEKRPWLAHLTVLRFRARPRLGPAPPDLGGVSPSEAALYHSVLRPGGAQYVTVESVVLGG
jgi:RNA 2',3'-cyclic 3'-phosphodiesterase